MKRSMCVALGTVTLLGLSAYSLSNFVSIEVSAKQEIRNITPSTFSSEMLTTESTASFAQTELEVTPDPLPSSPHQTFAPTQRPWAQVSINAFDYYICAPVEKLRFSRLDSELFVESINAIYGYEPSSKTWCAVKVVTTQDYLGFVAHHIERVYQNVEKRPSPYPGIMMYQGNDDKGRIVLAAVGYTADLQKEFPTYVWIEAVSAEATASDSMLNRLGQSNIKGWNSSELPNGS